MANITINGANYNDVPRIDVPNQSGGIFSFYETSGTLEVAENGTYDVKNKESVDVNVVGGSSSLSIDDIISGDYFDGKDIVYKSSKPINPYALASTEINEFTATQCEYVGQNAFDSCSITSFNGLEITRIGINGFVKTGTLKSVKLPKCERIDGEAFYMSAIETVDLPLLTELGDAVFASCHGLKSVNLPKLKIVSNQAFNSSENIESINIPACDYIQNYALAYINKLTHIYAPCSYVGSSAFSSDVSLECVDFSPKVSVGSIGYAAFKHCSLLKILCLRNEVVWSLSDSSCFDGTPIGNGNGYIYVPKSKIEEYKVATNWTVYATQFRALEDYTVDGTTTGEIDSSKI